MSCVLILYMSGGTYGLKSTPKDTFFEKLFMALLLPFNTFVPLFTLNWYNNNYNNNCLFARNFIQHWLNSYWLLPVLSYLFIYARFRPVDRYRSKRFMMSPCWEFYRDNLCMCILILDSHMIVIVVLFGKSSMNLCIVWTLLR